jgi:small subunit ribosomal protein S21
MINISIKLNKGDYFGKENIDYALKRFKSKVDAEEIMDTIRRKRAFETPKQIKIRKTKRLHRKMKENKFTKK